jgi:hypothetical protein
MIEYLIAKCTNNFRKVSNKLVEKVAWAPSFMCEGYINSFVY